MFKVVIRILNKIFSKLIVNTSAQQSIVNSAQLTFVPQAFILAPLNEFFAWFLIKKIHVLIEMVT